MTHQISTKWLGGMAFEATNPGGNFRIDGDLEIGGTNNGLRPKALMLDALAGCTGMDVASLMPKMKVAVHSFHIDVEGDLSVEHPKYYHTVRVVYHFYGNDLEKEKLQKIVNLSIEKYCGVMEMFRKFAQVDVKIEFHSIL
ncbi:MAG TPA: OsmC family protein [Flavobacterium sp.]|uniref:OsmC family protein n=1 Tax=unclassified Flavobacterium TaxID=196869 RepID=UPI000E7EDBFC|nr:MULTISPECIES: OsmC family protein [unclassified Flavobacterium]HBI01478.1 osmotically inducible protein OsmC [Flavobacterium sp.]HRE77653.1 OsmC family protein [Flavobacterium sp.]